MKDINYFKTKDSIFINRVTNKSQIDSILDSEGVLIGSSESEARKIIASLKDRKFKGMILVRGKEDAFNRRVIETLKCDYLVFDSGLNLKDSVKQRDSGLNHVVALEAKRKGIGFIIDMSLVRSYSGKEKGIILSKILQNIKICRRSKTQIKMASFGNSSKDIMSEKSRKSFGFSLGMDSGQSNLSTKFG